MEEGLGVHSLEAEPWSEGGGRAEADFESELFRAGGELPSTGGWDSDSCREKTLVCVDRNVFHALFCPEGCDISETALVQQKPPLPAHIGQGIVKQPL